MTQLLNTMYVQTQGTYLRLDHETIRVEVGGESKLQVPLHHLNGLVVFGNVLLSPFLIHKFAEDGRSIVWLTNSGRFKGRLTPPTSGNVLLRRAQFAALDDLNSSLSIARNTVAGKLQNARTTLLRSARDLKGTPEDERLRGAAEVHAEAIRRLPNARRLDEVRGLEGDAARAYFEVFDLMIRNEDEAFRFRGRNRRPPLDATNALLSFLYGVLRNDCHSALESVGLDPQVGFLHALRPGRPALALDMMEELRAPLVDRLVLTLINLRQVSPDGFIYRPGGAVELDETTRKKVVVAYQERKSVELNHPLLKSSVPTGLVPHIQARLLARHLRGDIPEYPPYLFR